jgi:DNA-binding NarL/FixJ family response regulator
VKIVFLTMHTDREYVQGALDAGASGYVIKHSASEDLELAINKALSGRTYITPSVAKDWIDYPAARKLSRTRHGSEGLTSRQREILQLLVEGKSAKQAAAILHVSPRTVEFHKYRMMQQLGLDTTAQLMQFAIRRKLIPV